MCPTKYQLSLLWQYLKIYEEQIFIWIGMLPIRFRCLIIFFADHKCHGYDYFDFYLLQNISDHVCVMIYYRKFSSPFTNKSHGILLGYIN